MIFMLNLTSNNLITRSKNLYKLELSIIITIQAGQNSESCVLSSSRKHLRGYDFSCWIHFKGYTSLEKNFAVT